MQAKRAGPLTIDAYIAACPKEVRARMQDLRATIKVAAPDAEEKISYQIPTFYLKGNLVHFAAFKDHLSFFPTSSGVEAFKQELSIYEGSKGTVRFPLDRPLPLKLVSRIVKFRVAENLRRAETRSSKRR